MDWDRLRTRVAAGAGTLGPADPTPDAPSPGVPNPALPVLLTDVVLDAEDIDDTVDEVEAVDVLEDIEASGETVKTEGGGAGADGEDGEVGVESTLEAREAAVETVDNPEATVMDLRFDTTVEGDSEAEPGTEEPEGEVEELGAADDPAVKRRSSLLGSSTDQLTSKTVERYECSDWGSSVDFGRGRGTPFLEGPDPSTVRKDEDDNSDGDEDADVVVEDVVKVVKVATGGRSRDGAGEGEEGGVDLDCAFIMAVNGFVSRFCGRGLVVSWSSSRPAAVRVR